MKRGGIVSIAVGGDDGKTRPAIVGGVNTGTLLTLRRILTMLIGIAD